MDNSEQTEPFVPIKNDKKYYYNNNNNNDNIAKCEKKFFKYSSNYAYNMYICTNVKERFQMTKLIDDNGFGWKGRGRVVTSIFSWSWGGLTRCTRDWTRRQTGFPAAWMTSTARSCVLCRRSTPSTSIIRSPI